MDLSNDKNKTTALHGGDVYRNEVRLDFSVNLNPLPMPAEVTEAMRAGMEEIHQYPDHEQQKLRESIASLEQTEPDSIVCGNGASELLMAAVHAVMPKRAVITAPCYAGYAVALKAADAEITEYFLDEDNDFAPDEGILELITDDTDMVFIADPNNPNGKLIDPALKGAIAQRCEECGSVLVIDECFYPLTGAGIRSGELNDNALHLRAFTKTFAIPGIRLGYVISRDREMLTAIRKHLPEWNVSRIAERTGEAAAALMEKTGYLEESVRMIDRERGYLAGQLEKLGIRVYGSDTNYILIRRCANFSGLDETYFRIAVRKHEENEELIKIIGEVI